MNTTSEARVSIRQKTSDADGAYLRREVDLRCVEVEEASLCGEGSDGDDTLEKLSEVREDGTASVRLHTTQVPTRVQIANGKTTVYVTEDRSREYKQWEDDTKA